MRVIPPISVVLLVHNEADIIENVIREFEKLVVSRIPESEIIVAEDGSTDGTKEILARLCTEITTLRWEEGKQRLGYARAFKRAIGLAKHEWILFCDSSGKHDPADFWKMVPLAEGHDLVIGYKVKRADPIYRVVIGKAFNFLVNRYFGVRFRDIDCPIRLIRRTAYLDIARSEWLERALVNFELTLRMFFRGYRVAQIPVTHRPRLNGASRGLPMRRIPRVVIDVLMLFPKLKKELSSSQFRMTR